METGRDAVAYAKEVYAACLTIGFFNDDVAALKVAIEASEADGHADPGRTVELAERAHLEAAAWAAGRAC